VGAARQAPDLPRPFRTPWLPLVSILGVGTCLLQMYMLPVDTWLRLAIWMALGFAVLLRLQPAATPS